MPSVAPTLTAKIGTGSTSLPFDVGTRSTGPVAPPGPGSRIELLPTQNDQKKTLTLGRYLFKSDGPGWECKETVGKGATRKRVYLKHLSRTRYEKMQMESATREELQQRLLDWADKEREKKRSP